MPLLTDRSVANAKTAAARLEIPDAKMTGLYLIVQPSGAKSWAVRYRNAAGTPRKFTLKGLYPALDLKGARAAAGIALESVANGADPAALKKAGAPVDGSLAASVATYRERHVSTLRNGTRLYVERELDAMEAAWPGRALRSLTKRDANGFIDAAVKRGRSATNTRWKIVRAFFAFCEEREDDFTSPARTIPQPYDEEKRDRVLCDDELRAVWHKAEAIGGAAGALAKLLILTGCRKTEISGLRWSEITADAIELPKERVKTNVPHRVPLTDAMRKVLAGLPRSGVYALNGSDRPYSVGGREKNKLAVDIPAWRLHDLRRSCATGMAILGIPVPVIEKCLNHQSGAFGGIVSNYNTHDYRAEVADAFTKWSAHIEAITR